MYGSKHRTTDGLYETRKDGSGYSSTKRESNLQTHGFNDDSSNHRKYIRTQSSNNRTVPSSSFSQQQRQNGDKDKKAVKDAKKPLRVFGDWSEFKSSTGKTYFYNCKTEISQWEKPKGWPADETTLSSIRTTSICSSTDRTKKETTNSNSSPTIRSRYKMDESTENSRYQQKDIPIPNSTTTIKYEQNGDIHSHTINNLAQESLQSNESFSNNSNIRLPSPNDDNNSRMSFSSTSSKESTAINISDRNGNGNENNGGVLHLSLSEPVISVSTPVSDIPNKLREKDSISLNGNEAKSSSTRTIIPSMKTEQTTEIEPSAPSMSKFERDQEIQKYYRGSLIQHLTDWPSTQLEKQCLKLFDDYYGYSAKMSTGFIELKALKSNFRVLEIKQNILRQRLLRCQQHVKEREDDKLL